MDITQTMENMLASVKWTWGDEDRRKLIDPLLRSGPDIPITSERKARADVLAIWGKFVLSPAMTILRPDTGALPATIAIEELLSKKWESNRDDITWTVTVLTSRLRRGESTPQLYNNLGCTLVWLGEAGAGLSAFMTAWNTDELVEANNRATHDNSEDKNSTPEKKDQADILRILQSNISACNSLIDALLSWHKARITLYALR